MQKVAIIGRSSRRSIFGIQIKRKNVQQIQHLKITERMSPKVNLFFALAMIAEGVAVDLKLEHIREVMVEIRHFVHETMPDRSETFGDWSEEIEQKYTSHIPQQELMPILLEMMWNRAWEIEKEHNRVEPFTFYHLQLITPIRQSAGEVNVELYRELLANLKTIRHG